MKILFLSDVFHPRVNGVSTSMETFAHGLQDAGHRVDIVCPDYGASPSSSPETPRVHRVASRSVPFDREDRWMSLRAALRLDAIRRADQYDLIHVHTPFVAHRLGRRIASRFARPLVTSYHTYFEGYLHHYLPVLTRWGSYLISKRLSSSQCRHADHVIVPSTAMHRLLLEYGVQTEISVLPTPIPEPGPGADGAAFRRHHDIDEGAPVLLHVGRMAHEKNIGFLVETVARIRRSIPDLVLVLAGEGPAMTSLRSLCYRLDLMPSVRFVGYLDRGVPLDSCYAAADLFLFASRTETQGLVLLEAMARGIPVVSTVALGTVDVLRPESGAILVAEDQHQFADQTVALLRSPATRQQLSEQGMEYVRQEWGVPGLVEKLTSLYESTGAPARRTA